MPVNSNDPIDYAGINQKEQPRFLTARRDPLSIDIYPPGTQWENPLNNNIYITPGEGIWSNLSPSGTEFDWTEVTGTTQAIAADNGYMPNNAAQVVFTLPATAAQFTKVRIAGFGAGGWRISQNAGQQINFDSTSTTAGATGYLESVNQHDAVELICMVADTTWNVISSMGNITVV